MDRFFAFATPSPQDLPQETTPPKGSRSDLAELSHELRSPLTVIRGYLQLAIRRGLGGEAEGMIEGALRATVRMEEMIQEMVDSRVP